MCEPRRPQTYPAGRRWRPSGGGMAEPSRAQTYPAGCPCQCGCGPWFSPREEHERLKAYQDRLERELEGVQERLRELKDK